jgi:flavodoxin
MSFFTLAHTEKAANVESNVSSVSQSTLVVYLSRTRNTAALARMIQQQTGAKLIAIELEAPYPKNYEEMVEQVRKENASGFLPPLATQITDLADFDTVFIGFPTWGMELPPPMK